MFSVYPWTTKACRLSRRGGNRSRTAAAFHPDVFGLHSRDCFQV